MKTPLTIEVIDTSLVIAPIGSSMPAEFHRSPVSGRQDLPAAINETAGTPDIEATLSWNHGNGAR
jgi:hypothetical protein